MPIYIESRNLDFDYASFVVEHQYLIYFPDGEVVMRNQQGSNHPSP